MSGVLGGFAVSEKYTKKVIFLRQCVDFIINLKTEIRYSQKPLCEILKNYFCIEPLSKYISICASYLKEECFEDSWKKAFANVSKEIGISKEKADVIINFGNELGSCDTEGQINYLDHNLNIIKDYLNEEIENKKTKGNLPIILGAGLSFSIALLFI